MGIIARQGIISTLFIYFGIVIGFITTAILLPKYLTTEEIGVLTLLVSYSSLYATLGNLGSQAMIIRLFPFFKSETSKKHNGLIGFANLIGLIGFLLVTIIYFIFKKSTIENTTNPILVAKYFRYIPILILATLFFQSFDSYNRALLRSVMGVFLKDFVQRIFILISILYYIVFKSFETFVLLYVISISLPTLLIFINLLIKGNFKLFPDFKFISPDLRKKMVDTSLFGILFGFGNVIVQRLDIIMLSWYSSLSLTGIYNISLFFGTIVSIPARALQRISTGVISDAFKKNDLKTIELLYAKSSLNQFIVGALVFLGLLINLHNIYRILPEEYDQGRLVIIFYGLTALSNMLFGLSSSIIGISPFYRYQTWLIVIYSVLIVATNFIFIPIYGINGAAFASFLSTLVYGFLMFIFLKKKYNFNPFSLKLILVALMALSLFFVNIVLPVLENIFFDIFYRSALISIVYLFLLIITKTSEDINRIFHIIFSYFKKYLS